VPGSGTSRRRATGMLANWNTPDFRTKKRAPKCSVEHVVFGSWRMCSPSDREHVDGVHASEGLRSANSIRTRFFLTVRRKLLDSSSSLVMLSIFFTISSLVAEPSSCSKREVSLSRALASLCVNACPQHYRNHPNLFDGHAVDHGYAHLHVSAPPSTDSHPLPLENQKPLSRHRWW
jgi:hypothetical protein